MVLMSRCNNCGLIGSLVLCLVCFPRPYKSSFSCAKSFREASKPLLRCSALMAAKYYLAVEY